MKWEKGRQGTGYEKLKLWSFWRTDCYLLRYPEGSGIPMHRDPVSGRKHWRVNIRFPGAKGGEFRSGGLIAHPGEYLGFQLFRRTIVVFRPDLLPHRVTTVTKGTRYVLSFGVAL